MPAANAMAKPIPRAAMADILQGTATDAAPRTKSDIGSPKPVAQPTVGLEVTDNLPKEVPILPEEISVLEMHLGKLLDRYLDGRNIGRR